MVGVKWSWQPDRKFASFVEFGMGSFPPIIHFMHVWWPSTTIFSCKKGNASLCFYRCLAGRRYLSLLYRWIVILINLNALKVWGNFSEILVFHRLHHKPRQSHRKVWAHPAHDWKYCYCLETLVEIIVWSRKWHFFGFLPVCVLEKLREPPRAYHGNWEVYEILLWWNSCTKLFWFFWY